MDSKSLPAEIIGDDDFRTYVMSKKERVPIYSSVCFTLCLFNEGMFNKCSRVCGFQKFSILPKVVGWNMPLV